MSDYQPHPIAELFPEMTGEDYIRLAGDIETNGLREPIWLFDGQILDGRHRYKACLEVGADPRFEIFEGDEDEAMLFSLSLNLARRHMTAAQRAFMAVDIKKWEARRAKSRQGTRTDLVEKIPPSQEGEESLNLKQGTEVPVVERIPQQAQGKARDLAGERVGVNGKYVDQAEKIAKEAPDVAERAKRNEYGPMTNVRRAARLEPEVRERVHERMDAGLDFKAALNEAVGEPEGDINCTPSEWVDLARKIMGDIDLDPASNDAAQEVVQAATYYTIENDGLLQPWSGRVWCNPPYSSGMISKFVDKIVEEWERGEVTQMMVLTNASLCADWWQRLARASTKWAAPKSRIQFWRPHASQGASNDRDQSIFYFGHSGRRFEEVMQGHEHLPMESRCNKRKAS